MRPSIRKTLRAFSLIEVLISVVVLALGLLGLGAMFPVVIRQQRQAVDTALGLSAINSAKAELEGNLMFQGGQVLNASGTMQDLPGFGANDLPPFEQWFNRLNVAAFKGRIVDPEEYVDLNSGELLIGDAQVLRVPVGARLFPSAHSANVQPRYVWDVLARTPNLPGVSSDREEIQLVVFIRPIDQNIRVDRGSTLSDMIATRDNNGLLLPTPDRLAVAVNQGRPMLTGVGQYSAPASMNLQNVAYVDEAKDPARRRTRMRLNPSGADEQQLASYVLRVGQRIVDSFGNVYTVRNVADAETYSVDVDPPVPSRYENASEISPVYFTPQMPAEVRVLTIKP
jgi:hypothetical protein